MFSRDLRNASAEGFARACEALGGRVVPGKADVSAVIPYAPRFPVTVHFWCGDEEFPASGKNPCGRRRRALSDAGGGGRGLLQRGAGDHSRVEAGNCREMNNPSR